MIKRLESLRIPAGIYYFSVCFILLINFSSAYIHHSNSSDDENVVNSDGMWQKEVQTMKPPKLSQGASRFDVGGILTTFGMKQGGSSIFALVMLPILFPLMVLMAVALFVISFFGSSGLGLAVAGRRYGYGATVDDAMNIISHSGGGASGFPYSAGYNTVIDRDGFPITMLTNRDGLAFDVLQDGNDDDKDACIERFVCEILVHGGIGKVLGKKATLQLLRGLNVKPTIITNVLPNSSPGRKPRKVWKCSSLSCDWEKWSPWTEDTRGTFTNYIGS